jgi:hypothetical protein
MSGICGKMSRDKVSTTSRRSIQLLIIGYYNGKNSNFRMSCFCKRLHVPDMREG